MKTLELSREELDYVRQWIEHQLDAANAVEQQLDEAKGSLSVAQYLVLHTLAPLPARLRTQGWRMAHNRTARVRFKSAEIASLWLLLNTTPIGHHSVWGRNVLQQVASHTHYVLTQQLGHSPTLE